MTPLTYRQQQIVELLLAGCDRRIVCERLRIERETLRSHLGDIRRKLGAPDTSAMMRVLREDRRDPARQMREQCKESPRQWWMV